MRWARSALAILAVLGVGGVARADSASLPLELTWDAPAECPAAAFVVHRVEQLLRGPKTSPTVLVAKAKIARAGDGPFELALSMRMADVEETRTVAAPSCSALAEAAAVVIALVLDPSMTEPPVAEEPAPEAPPGAPVETPPRTTPLEGVPATTEAPPAAKGSASPPALRVALGLGGSMASGTLPSVGAGFVGSAAVRVHRVRVGVLGTAWPRQSPSYGGSAGASFDLIEVGAFTSYMLPLGVFGLGPSAGLEATYMRVEGFGIRAPRATTTFWPTAALGARVEQRLHPRLGLFAQGDLLLPIGAPSFTLATSGDAVRLHEPSAVAGRLSLGVEIVLP